ncbi:MAG: hypothetical protein WBQ89_18850, partial [Candidatus Acidiferrum sp.]
NNLETTNYFLLGVREQAAASDFDGLALTAFVSVTNYVRQSFVHGTNDGAGIGILEVYGFGGSLQGCAHQAKGLGVTFEV